MLKHYIEFHFANDKTELQEIKKITPIIKLPKGAYAYRYFDRNELPAEDGEIVLGTFKNVTPLTYVGGIVYTLEDLEVKFPKEKDLVKTMYEKGYTKAIFTSVATWRILEEDDVVIKD